MRLPIHITFATRLSECFSCIELSVLRLHGRYYRVSKMWINETAYSHTAIILFYIQFCVCLNDLFLSLWNWVYHRVFWWPLYQCSNSNATINNVLNGHERMLHCLHFGVTQIKTLIVIDLARMIIIFLEFAAYNITPYALRSMRTQKTLLCLQSTWNLCHIKRTSMTWHKNRFRSTKI